MIDINKEAEKYLLGFREGEVPKSFDEVKQIYIAGHNSKATQAKVIQGQINILKEYSDYYWNKISTERILKHIEILQKELKQLENEIS
jgi:hypothetical protein